MQHSNDQFKTQHLGRREIVGSCPGAIDPTHHAHPDSLIVMALHMGAGLIELPTELDLPVSPDDCVVAYFLPPSGAVPVVYLVGAYVT